MTNTIIISLSVMFAFTAFASAQPHLLLYSFVGAIYIWATSRKPKARTRRHQAPYSCGYKPWRHMLPHQYNHWYHLKVRQQNILYR